MILSESQRKTDAKTPIHPVEGTVSKRKNLLWTKTIIANKVRHRHHIIKQPGAGIDTPRSSTLEIGSMGSEIVIHLYPLFSRQNVMVVRNPYIKDH
ncbi:hypothetical protein [Xenorhabdus hominickii]|uniref:hypothetical protein n=1 Tax=Xenorhabdus hominickii TaxID=351679 RepID=UPI0018DE1EB9|nr:hypothetical protein [Xenorhabdus hominickii]